MDKEKVKEMLSQAIDNIPDCAEITDCYTEHSYGSKSAYIYIAVEIKESAINDENISEFHNIAHRAFGTNMDFIS